MSLEILDLSWNLVIWVLMSFAIGITSVTFYIKLKAFLKKSSHQTDNSVVEAVVSEYTSKLEEFRRIIGELKVRIDTVELRLLQSPISQTSNISDAILTTRNDVRTISQSKSLSQEHQSPVPVPTVSTKSQPREHQLATITPSSVAITGNTSTTHYSTSDYILKLLAEKSRTSREIQTAIGRTREHTSRLMRKLYESNLVSRDNHKPFGYKITDEGRRELTSHNKTGEAIASNINTPPGSQGYQLKVVR
ncbi:MAG TPA: helix-turn-helix domain-containing protein [Candidatus Bathyarchaeia archaeon]|nr:helix-turn-helix domain-containing protein [Candidatus Bathyarchaeia archaeon]